MQKKRNIKVALRSNPQMGRIMNFEAEWFFFEEIKVLQGVSVLTSVREWQYKDIPKDIDGLMWEDLSADPQEVPVQIHRTAAQPRSVPASPSPQKNKRSSFVLRNLLRSVLDVRWIHLEQDVSG